MPDCELCGDRESQPDSVVCEQCSLTLFQLEDIIDEYSKDGEPPDEVISEFLREIRGVYKSNIKTRAYFNSAAEIVRTFVDEGVNEIPIREIRSIAQSTVAQPKLLKVLSDARIIERDDDVVKQGELTQSILRVKWEQLPRESDKWTRRIQEVYGLLAVSLTITLIRLDGETPRSALAVFHLVSSHVIAAESMGSDSVSDTIPQIRIQGSFAKASRGAQDNIERDLLAFGSDGCPKIVKDVNEDGAWVPKEISLEYMNRVLERWRDRGRDREITLER